MQSKDRMDVLAWRSLLYTNFHVLKRLSEEMLLEQNLELSWYEVLLHVSEAKGPITQRDLQERVMLGQSGLSRVLTRMEAADLVRRCALENDRRILSVELTPIGRERLRRAARVHLAGIKRWFGDQLTTHDSEIIGASLERVLNNLAASDTDSLVPDTSAMFCVPTASPPLPAADALATLERLEPMAWADAASYATASDITVLRHHLSDLARHLNSPLKFSEADWKLRLRIVEISPNEVLLQVCKSLVVMITADLQAHRDDDYVSLQSLATTLERRTDLIDAIAKSDQRAIDDLV